MKKNIVLKHIRFGMLLIIFFAVPIFFEAYASASLGRPESGQAGHLKTAPSFKLKTVSGKKVSLSDSQGKGRVLFFFTTWCPYCIQKFPSLAKDYPSFQKDGIELLVIDSGESEAKVASFAKKMNTPFEILLDEDMSVAEDYGVVGVPTFYLVNAAGSIVFEGNELPSNYKILLSR